MILCCGNKLLQPDMSFRYRLLYNDFQILRPVAQLDPEQLSVWGVVILDGTQGELGSELRKYPCQCLWVYIGRTH